MSSIYIVETIFAAKGKEEELKKQLLNLIPLSQKDDGCISYDLLQDCSRPERLVVLMCWKDRQAYENHCKAPHIAEFDKNLYTSFEEKFYQSV